MYCFPVIRLVLDDLYEQIPLANNDQKIQAISRELKLLRDLYQGLCKGNLINYNSPITRFAYTYCYVASHADVMYQLVKDNYAIKKLLNNNAIKIACLGGGPGSDLLGILKFMRLENLSAKLICNIYDREESWKSCIESITNKTKVFAHQLNIEPTIYGTVFFRELDIVESIRKEFYDEISDTNLFTISFLVSETKQSEAKPLFMDIFDKAQPGSLFIFIDNCSGDAHIRFDSFVDDFNEFNFRHHIYLLKSEQKNFCVDNREDKEDLDPYWSRLQSYPRLKLPVHYRIYHKI